MDNRYEIAEQNGMSREFADWFFDNKKAGCGNVWFMMMAAMWEGWQGRAAMLRGAEKTEPLHAVKDAPALDSSSRIAESLHADFQGAEPVTTAYKLPEPIKNNRLNSGAEADDYYSGYQAGWNECLESVQVICEGKPDAK